MTPPRRRPLGPPHPYREDPISLRCHCGLPAINHIHTDPADPPEQHPDAAVLSSRILGEQPDQED
jgi:hypothetical protein